MDFMGMGLSFLGLDRLMALLKGSDTVMGSVNSRIKTMGTNLLALIKKATPVDTGRLRSSIGVMASVGNQYTIGTSVHYAPFVEYGTRFMEARHVEGGGQRRVLGTGPFSYAVELLGDDIREDEDAIANDIEKKFDFRSIRGFIPFGGGGFPTGPIF